MPGSKVGLTKEERLYHKKEIDDLFKEGTSFVFYPVRVVWRAQAGEGQQHPVSMLVSVPKRKVKKAVQRNRIKRLLREAFRLNKALLTESVSNYPVCCQIAFIWLSDKPSSFEKINGCIRESLTRIKQEVLEIQHISAHDNQ
jgi:ribonuclease P protein component